MSKIICSKNDIIKKLFPFFESNVLITPFNIASINSYKIPSIFSKHSPYYSTKFLIDSILP